MEEWVVFFGVLANITTSMVYLAPTGTIWRVLKKRSTEEFEGLPFVCMLLNASLWTYYGIIKPGGLFVATVNGFGAVVLSICLIIFLTFAPPKMKVETGVLALILNVGLVVGAILVTRLCMDFDAQINSIGLVATVFTIVSYGSPLAAMRTVLTTKSVEFMPFFLSLFLCISGFIWAVYAVLVRDYFIGIPNGTGSLLGAAQLIVYAMYRNNKPSKNSVDSLEDGSIHEPLISSSDRS